MGDLRSAVNGASRSALAAMDSVRCAALYTSVSTTEGTVPYDPVAGTVTRPGTQHQIRILFTSYKNNEIDGESIKSLDMRATISASEVTFIPKGADFMSIDSIQWEIVKIKREPSGSVFILQVRPA
jgi:hypothetical protein